jgi:hypothetical protein
VAATGVGPACAQKPAPELRKIHVLLVIDTNSGSSGLTL